MELLPGIHSPVKTRRIASPAIRATLKQVTLNIDRTGVVIIGGGPAGLAPLLAAHRSGRLAELLEQGVTVVEQSAALGDGSIGRRCINSNPVLDRRRFLASIFHNRGSLRPGEMKRILARFPREENAKFIWPAARNRAVRRIRRKLIRWREERGW
jgi:flavin-dependent dehydrogenase